MIEKAYVSNLCGLWPVEKQKEIIDAKLKDYGVPFADILRSDEKRKHKKELPERSMMLRPTQRSSNERINFATFAAAAYSAEDFLVVLAMAADRRSQLRDLNEGFVVRTRGDWQQAIKIFEAARRRNGEFECGHLGGIRSAEVRGLKVDVAAAACKDEWPLYNYTSAELAAEHGVSVGGLKKRLGSRKEIRAIARMSRKSKATKELNKCRKL